MNDNEEVIDVIQPKNKTNNEDSNQLENEEDDVHMIEDVQHEDLNQENCFPLNIFIYLFLNLNYLLKIYLNDKQFRDD